MNLLCLFAFHDWDDGKHFWSQLYCRRCKRKYDNAFADLMHRMQLRMLGVGAVGLVIVATIAAIHWSFF